MKGFEPHLSGPFTYPTRRVRSCQKACETIYRLMAQDIYKVAFNNAYDQYQSPSKRRDDVLGEVVGGGAEPANLSGIS